MSVSKKKIQHFYSRAGFGIPIEFYFSELTLKEHIDLQFKNAQTPGLFSVKEPKVTKGKMTKEMRDQLRSESKMQSKRWFEKMVYARENALLEKMSLFWHGHLACRIILGSKVSAEYINALRKNALGNFRDLIVDVSKTAAMIRYLNNQQNKKASPNENFARELMELFTIGRGNYSEQDVKEAARAFTGWSSNLKGNYVFRKNIHDTGVKTFMNETGHFGGEDIIDIILSKPQTAPFIADKAYRYFVDEKGNDERVKHLGKKFYDSGYEISVLMRNIFESDWFYEKEYVNTMIKSPIHLLVNFCQITNARINGGWTFKRYSRKLGQQLLDPPNVAGWPGGRAWIDNASLAFRMNIGMVLLYEKGLKNNDIKPNTIVAFERVKKYSKNIKSDLSKMILGTDRIGELKKVSNMSISAVDDYNKLVAALTSQLEYQMC